LGKRVKQGKRPNAKTTHKEEEDKENVLVAEGVPSGLLPKWIARSRDTLGNFRC